MKNRFLSIVCITISMIAFCSNKVYAQSKFHFDIDYHYNLGLSTSNTNGSGHWGRGDYKMGGNQISVKTLDLDCEFAEIKRQLDDIVQGYFGCS